ncbi:DUF4926 domain-containing protein [Alteromonas ponticola]|uniref:DUF4926 domain-containing protein n=1 Tax=Alteromonas ponticola TaxID=2720613 RepID=A0ABX1R779_9ALTE|nr:DUF4926 domain-containing protein [Alteromonas ponticola]NMH61546.1 DUF4926 domain-containing protein [Alteromonas ponticola]
MYKEYDVVIANKALSENIKCGYLGTILICYDDSFYEVEFLNEFDEFVGIMTVSEGDLNKA